MPPELLVQLGFIGLTCANTVGLLWLFRHPRANPDQVDVDELALEVVRIAKQVRRDRMRAVRAGEGGDQDAPLAGPPELRAAPPPTPLAVTKDELRRRVFGSRP